MIFIIYIIFLRINTSKHFFRFLYSKLFKQIINTLSVIKIKRRNKLIPLFDRK